ncbi:hypothetical protein [Thiohalorhabdus sp.]|uniref:hypothetical protein n=1 Tax=Thiohalorhabdus sp. TaxID=3094134 RepID=UPI002FC30C49
MIPGLLVPPPASSKAGEAKQSQDEPAPEASSEPEDPRSGEPTAGGKVPRPWYKRTLDVTHGGVSRGIEGTAKRLDSFFATPEALEEATGSHIKLTYDGSWIEGQGDGHELDLDARLDLPGTEERFQLLVESSPEQAIQGTEATDTSDAAQETPGEEAEKDDDGLAVAIEGWLEAGRDVRWKIRPALGIRGGLPLNPFTRLRVIRREQYAKWDSRFATNLAYFYQQGLRFRADLNFDRRLTGNLLFRIRSGYGWDRQPDVETFQHSLTLFQTLSPRRRLAYQLGVSASDQPAWGVRQYYARIRYRQRIYQHWLFAEVRPRLRWPEADRYGPEYGVLFRLEAVFGEQSLRRSRGKEKEP